MRLLLSCCFVLSYLNLLLALDTSTCGTTKSCVFSTAGCNSTDPTCLIFTYAWSASTNTFAMELSGGTGAGGQYVAVAFSPNGQMETSDMYYCIGTELKSGAIQGLRSPPVTTTNLPSEITGASSVTTNGVAECTFNRAASVTKDVGSGSLVAFDLSTTNYYVLLAIGGYTTNLEYHGSTGRFFSGPNNFTVITVTPTIPSVITPTPGSNDISSGCETTKSCFTSPDDCTPGISTCMFASWSYVPGSDEFNFEVVGGTTSGYVAIAFGSVNKMENADLYYCTSQAVTSGAIRQLRNTPFTSADLPPEISNVVTGANGATIRCSFTRSANVPKEISGGQVVDFNLLTNNYYLLYAYGNLRADGRIDFHTDSTLSGSLLNFTEITNTGGGSSNTIDLVKAHACLMLIAWLTCASIGVIIARHFKPLWHESKLFGEKVWFQLHRALMITTMLCTIAGFVLIFVAVGGYSEFAGAHPILGIIVTALVIINPVMAIFRPHPGAPKRSLFNWGHWFVGSLARILAIVAIFLGVDLSRLDLPEWDTWVMVGFVVFHIITEIILEVLSAYYEHIAVYVKLRSPESIGMDGEPQKVNPPPRGTSIKYFILLIYTIVNLGFLIAFIVTIADQ